MASGNPFPSSVPQRRAPASFRRQRSGQSLVEFAIVAIALYILIAGTLTFGYWFFAAQNLQTAVDLAAREISRTPLPPDDFTLEEVLRTSAADEPALAEVRRRVYDDHYLVLNLDTLHGRGTLQELIGDLPVVNQQLVPVMIADTVGGVRVLRYPGAIFADSDAADDPVDPPASGFRVAIPLVVGRDATGVETIDWIPVVEEIDSATNPDPFLLSSEQRGIVALRINYPAQSAAMSSFRPNPAGPFEPNVGNPNVADDAEVTVVDNDGFSPGGMSPVASDASFGTYAGSFGLGRQAALGQLVRPYRRVISAQAIFRREVID